MLTFTLIIKNSNPVDTLNQDDIINVTPLNGIFFTGDEDADIIEVGDTITFECTDDDKVPNNGLDDIEVRCLPGGWFDTPDWPGN